MTCRATREQRSGVSVKQVRECPHLNPYLSLNTATGRPTGSPTFVARLEALLGRGLTAGKRGHGPRGQEHEGNE